MKTASTKKIIATVEKILSEFNPIFEAHGGGAELVAVEHDTVTLRVIGNCYGCSLAPMTFGMGVDEMIRKELPQIKEIKYTV
ncbi:MAG: Nitrogen-fixing NifU domain-containing protein [Parcubacteria group bacterium GW2011_GWA2_49_9]|nr:MAG: Nitrogen-fixing NifU domain-containing protein [Parcubacteria group bacterium GW2011_GWA2_49_9]